MGPAIRIPFAAALLALAAPSLAQTPFAAPSEAVVIGQAYDVPSRRLGKTRRVHVALPPDYSDAKNRAVRYPVLYLLDSDGPRHFTHVAALAQEGALARTTQPIIVVGVDRPSSANADDLRAFLAEELKPNVAAAYRTDGSDALMGASAAGLFVVDTAMRHGADFDRYISISPTLGQDRLPGDAARLLSGARQAPRILWLTTGTESADTQRGMDRLVAALRARTPAGMTWTYAPMPGENPAAMLHPAAMRALRMLFPAPR